MIAVRNDLVANSETVRDALSTTALGIVGPRPQQVESAVDERVAAARGVAQVYRDLSVLKPPGCVGASRCTPTLRPP